MIKEKSCGAVVFKKHKDGFRFVLVQQRYGGHYGFPKGHVENSESEVMTAYREVKEETGLDVKLLDSHRAEVNYSPKKGVTKQVVYFLAEAKTIELKKQDEEILDVKWLDADQVLTQLTFENDRKLFKKLVRPLLNTHENT